MSHRSNPSQHPAVPTSRPSLRLSPRPNVDTKTRLLDAAELLFIDDGYDAMALRQITALADANLAAVSYHFGAKDALVHAMLARRLDGLNQDRLDLLERLETSLATALTCEHVLGAMFLPALHRARSEADGGPALLRLVGRVYTDPAPFVQRFLRDHYSNVAERFFAAFQRALPHLPREELGWRLHFFIGSISRSLASPNTDQLIHDFSQGNQLDDSQLIGRLALLMVAALQAPLPSKDRACPFASLIDKPSRSEPSADKNVTARQHETA